MKNPEEKLKLVFCADCIWASVVVKEDHCGDAYCTDCMTDERLKETEPDLWNKIQNDLKQQTICGKH